MVLPKVEAMAKDWMVDGVKEETEDAAVAEAVAESVIGTAGMATGGSGRRAVGAA